MNVNAVVVSDLPLVELHLDNPGNLEYYETIHLFIIKLDANIITTPLDLILGASRILKLSKLHLGES